MNKIRVTVQQPSLAAYRVPFFRELAQRNEIQLRVVYGDRTGIANVSPDGFEGEEVHLYRFKLGPIPLYWHSPQWTEANRDQIDVIVLVWNVQYLSLIPALLKARWKGIRTVLWGHGTSKRDSSLRRRLRYIVTHLADGVIFYDKQTAEQMVKAGLLSKKKAHVAPNAIDSNNINAVRLSLAEQPELLQEFCETKGITPTHTILFVSRLHRDNRLDLLLEAMPIILSQHPEAKVLIVGKGDVEQERLVELAAERSISKAIVFSGPVFDETELGKHFLSSSVFCYPENIGLSFLHALHYGLPVITCNDRSRQNPEFCHFEDGINGYLYQADSPENLAMKICSLLQDSDKRTQMASHNLEFASKHLSIQAMADGFIRSLHSQTDSKFKK